MVISLSSIALRYEIVDYLAILQKQLAVLRAQQCMGDLALSAPASPDASRGGGTASLNSAERPAYTCAYVNCAGSTGAGIDPLHTAVQEV